MTKEQKETVEMLSSQLDNLQVIGPAANGECVFEGEGVDGPSVGYIRKDGKIDWLVNGGWSA